ncbi:MAG TPA: hypothetical protein VM939_01145 [Gemmatimonadaceae bacterium]|nr:hypothetical protein [Gemmatimonadaceae bacterium]
MTRIGIMLGLSVAMLACTKSDSDEPPPKQEAAPRPVFTDAGKGAQQRIGSYLQSSVVTDKLRTCWTQLQGEGAVAVDLTYRKSGDNWTFDSATVKKSSLAKGQEATVQRCIEESARATTFPRDSNQPLETAADQFVVRLGWSVPLPAEGTQLTSTQMARMIGTGGVITVPGCSECVSRKEYPYGLKCEARSSGSNTDCEEINTNTCAYTPKACLRGAFGGTSGVIMW